ncbi:MAG: TetR/AcrR family transcriptional regulator [Phycisphaerae bacterium]|nr:TetR/AcrR family transcriptional regulator [Phycisphaerae bacterium]
MESVKSKDEIINASIRLTHFKGYKDTSVKDITDAAGIPKGPFYGHFEDKEHYALDALNDCYYELNKNSPQYDSANTLSH